MAREQEAQGQRLAGYRKHPVGLTERFQLRDIDPVQLEQGPLIGLTQGTGHRTAKQV